MKTPSIPSIAAVSATAGGVPAYQSWWAQLNDLRDSKRQLEELIDTMLLSQLLYAEAAAPPDLFQPAAHRRRSHEAAV